MIRTCLGESWTRYWRTKITPFLITNTSIQSPICLSSSHSTVIPCKRGASGGNMNQIILVCQFLKIHHRRSFRGKWTIVLMRTYVTICTSPSKSMKRIKNPIYFRYIKSVRIQEFDLIMHHKTLECSTQIKKYQQCPNAKIKKKLTKAIKQNLKNIKMPR